MSPHLPGKEHLGKLFNPRTPGFLICKQSILVSGLRVVVPGASAGTQSVPQKRSYVVVADIVTISQTLEKELCRTPTGPPLRSHSSLAHSNWKLQDAAKWLEKMC